MKFNITRWLYTSSSGRKLLNKIIEPKWSVLMGKFMDSGLSVFLIKPFISKNNIDLNDYKIKKWKSFNEFFTRELKPYARPVENDKDSFISPCDGLLTVYDTDERFNIKGYDYTLKELLKGDAIADEFIGGKCLVYRLTPSHYHRYCYIDDGFKEENVFINGVLHTVQPIGLENTEVFNENSREYTVLHTENFDDIVQIEVGAMFVGRIVNYHNEYTFKRGEEKGKFEFGGSTIVVLVKKNTVEIFDEILRSKDEYAVKMGQAVGYKRV